MRVFLLDLNRCTGCQACRLACSIENQLGEESSWRTVYTFNAPGRPQVPRFHLSLACHHCADPACLRCCPARAYTMDGSTGAVLVNPDHCIGCRYCTWACPYDAPCYLPAAGTIAKCTLCHHRLAEGSSPACAALCPTGALQYREADGEAAAEAVPGFPDTDLHPSIRFIPLRPPGAGPELRAAAPPAPEPEAAPDGASGPKASPGREWPLVVFTLGTALLVAVAGAVAEGALRVSPEVFLMIALGLAGVSSLHLGRAARGWRAVLNPGQSWLSREILLFLAFAGLTTGFLLGPSTLEIPGWPAVLAGLACLYSIDRVYETVSLGIWTRLHSARALLTGLFLLGILGGNPIVAGIAGLAKLILYAYRRPWARGRGRLAAAVLRLGLGFVVPLAVWRVYPQWVLPAVLAGELIDRCEYYLDLEIRSPGLHCS